MSITISLNDIGRRFNRHWIFRGMTYTFGKNGSYAVLGPNGSGKSTLLQIIAGALTVSEGAITYSIQDKPVDPGDVFQSLSISAPYLELIEEFTLREQIRFHFRFKSYRDGLNENDVLDLLKIPFYDRQIKNFSSGMKQRTKLVLACCSDSRLLVLDEPTANLDTEGIDWYLQLVERFTPGRVTIIGSNQAHEYAFCDERLYVTDFN